jgi:hypothetical protein
MDFCTEWTNIEDNAVYKIIRICISSSIRRRTCTQSLTLHSLYIFSSVNGLCRRRICSNKQCTLHSFYLTKLFSVIIKFNLCSQQMLHTVLVCHYLQCKLSETYFAAPCTNEQYLGVLRWEEHNSTTPLCLALRNLFEISSFCRSCESLTTNPNTAPWKPQGDSGFSRLLFSFHYDREVL